MARDWIKMRCNLRSDPGVLSIAADTGLDEFGVVGRLHAMWALAAEHTTDGSSLNVTTALLDRYVGVTGFARAMQSAGWLIVNTVDGGPEESVIFPNCNTGDEVGEKQLHKKKPARRQRRCPERFEFDLSVYALGRELGVNTDRELAQLRDYEFRSPRSDWNAVARTWLRKAAEMGGNRGGNRPRFAGEASIANFRRVMEELGHDQK